MVTDEPLSAFIIEDDEDLANIFTEAVTAAGFQVETFQEGNSALARLKEIVPYVVILDLHLPGVTGPEILRFIRSDERLKRTRVVIASADERLAEYTQDEYSLVLLKPISFMQLRDIADRLKPRKKTA